LLGRSEHFSHDTGPRDPMSKKIKPWQYHVSHPWPMVMTAYVIYIFIMVTGLSGLCLAPSHRWKLFTALNLAMLSMTPAVGLMYSRFRLGFMPLIIIYSAYILGVNKSISTLLKDMSKSWILIFCILLFLIVILTTYDQIGQLG